MTRRQLRAIAFALYDAKPVPVDSELAASARRQWEADVEAVARALESELRDNKRLLRPFDRARFIRACETGLDNPKG